MLKLNLLIHYFAVLNVYDGFFGPCNAIATNLRDFKMVHAGDDLQIASVRTSLLFSKTIDLLDNQFCFLQVNADQIDVFKRFRNKSEPAYLMILV